MGRCKEGGLRSKPQEVIARDAPSAAFEGAGGISSSCHLKNAHSVSASSAPSSSLNPCMPPAHSKPRSEDVPAAPEGRPSNPAADVFPLEGVTFAVDAEFTFCSWVSSVPRLLRDARTQFAHFLVSTLALCRDDSLSPSTALFPLPLLRPKVFDQRPCRGASAHLRLSVQRCVHLVAMALNYVHAGCKPVSLLSLQRPLSPFQVQAYDRIGVLVRACEARSVPSCAGRRGLHTAARLSEVIQFLGRSGLVTGSYSDLAFPPEGDGFVPHVKKGPEALNPYGDIKADAVALHGKGEWNLAAHLGPELLLPYLEPEVMQFEGTGGPCASFEKEDPEILGLCKLWDASGLLGITAGPLPERKLTRIFGAFKAPGKQRQIGDRRGQNSLEGRLLGPSRFLPTGPLLARVHVPKGCCLVGSVTDRRDFYTQARVSEERAVTNAIGPAFRLGAFKGTNAYSAFLLKSAQDRRQPRGKGHFLGEPPPALLVNDKSWVHPTFKALLQGDAGGVEYATAAHEDLLQHCGCLQARGRLENKRPVAPAGPWDGLIIDDYFSLSVEDRCFQPGSESASSLLIAQAKSGYADEAVLGSEDKDVISQRVFKVAGAEVISDPHATRDGVALVGFPVEKRLALAAASLRAAQCAGISEELASMLSGSWVACLMYRRGLMSVLDGLFGLGRTSSAGSSEGSQIKPLPRKIASELQVLALLAPVACSNLSAGVWPDVFASDASIAKGAFCATPCDSGLGLDLWLAADFKGHAAYLDGRSTLRHSSHRPRAFQTILKKIDKLPTFSVPNVLSPMLRSRSLAATTSWRSVEVLVRFQRPCGGEVSDRGLSSTCQGLRTSTCHLGMLLNGSLS